jgi:flagellin-like hook-associated protein FlgL
MGEGIQNIKAADAGITAITSLIEAAKGLAEAALGTASTTDRAAFALQYDQLRAQMDTMASDSSYRGTNLLNGQDLTVNFNEDATAKLTVTSFTATSTGLTVNAAAAAWSATSDITTAQSELKTATDTLRTQSKNLAGNLNIITTRQTFTDKMINTLQTGSDHLTLADMNNEGANMLMLQTRQSLGTTALSMSAQAAQSVLKLF